ncbi:MAG: sulfatase-like hydrolase/transferase, partial [Verrucomicrobia bacterium]|nr:sulfatase-like hydrolase/transferase [Verrucomicrobiota bacterium]
MTCNFLPARRAAAALGILLALTGPLRAEPAAATPPPNPRRPSLILIVADGLGYGDLGCYGQARIKTPHLDRMAAAGVRFTSFYAASPASATARAALLLGRDS